MNDLSLLDLGTRSTPSPQRQRRNPFLSDTTLPPPKPSRLEQPAQSPKVPPRTNSPSARKAKNNNNDDEENRGVDLIKF